MYVFGSLINVSLRNHYWFVWKITESVWKSTEVLQYNIGRYVLDARLGKVMSAKKLYENTIIKVTVGIIALF